MRRKEHDELRKARVKAAVTFIIAVLALGTWVGGRSLADGNEVTPGSVEDPVVTKSYVDQKLAAISGGQTGTATPPSGNTSAAEVQVVSVPIGKRLIAKDGAEFIVRSGKAVVYSADANGISDLTDGVDLTNGKSIPNNHLILFPRGGRGVEVSSAQKTGAIVVFVRGGYELTGQ